MRESFLKELIRHLGPHGPDALLVVGVLAFIPALIEVGIDRWWATAICCGLFGLYAVRQTWREKHLERMERMGVQRKQIELEQLRERQKAKLQKIKRSAETQHIGTDRRGK